MKKYAPFCEFRQSHIGRTAEYSIINNSFSKGRTAKGFFPTISTYFLFPKVDKNNSIIIPYNIIPLLNLSIDFQYNICLIEWLIIIVILIYYEGLKYAKSYC